MEQIYISLCTIMWIHNTVGILECNLNVIEKTVKNNFIVILNQYFITNIKWQLGCFTCIFIVFTTLILETLFSSDIHDQLINIEPI